MCIGGGGGDPGAAARQQEAERQARIKAATETINSIFNNQVQKTGTRQVLVQPDFGQQYAYWALGDMGDNLGMEEPKPYYRTETYNYWAPGDPNNSRDRLYDDQRNTIYDLNRTEVDRQAEQAARTNLFGLARSGLLGGSQDIDSNAELNRRTNEGLMRAGSIADQSAADFRRSDEQLRSNLISMAQSGIDTGTAAQMALNGLATNAQSMAAQRGGATIGGLFDDLSYAYLANQQRQGINNATNPFGSQWFGVSSTRSGETGEVRN